MTWFSMQFKNQSAIWEHFQLFKVSLSQFCVPAFRWLCVPSHSSRQPATRRPRRKTTIAGSHRKVWQCRSSICLIKYRDAILIIFLHLAIGWVTAKKADSHHQQLHMVMFPTNAHFMADVAEPFEAHRQSSSERRDFSCAPPTPFSHRLQMFSGWCIIIFAQIWSCLTWIRLSLALVEFSGHQ